MEISSRGKTRARKWGERKDARSFDCAGRGVAFQGRERLGRVLKWPRRTAASLVRHRCQVPHALCLYCERRNGWPTLNATCQLTFSRKAEGSETVQIPALRPARIESSHSRNSTEGGQCCDAQCLKLLLYTHGRPVAHFL